MTDTRPAHESAPWDPSMPESPPRPVPKPGLMGLKDMREATRNTPRFLVGLRDRHGPVARVPMGRTNAFLISDADLAQDVIIASSRRFAKNRHSGLERIVGQGLATSLGASHRRQRRLIQPVFHHRRIEGYGSAFAAIADQASAGFTEGFRFDFHEAMYELALGMVTRTLFDVSIDSEAAARIRTAFPREGGPARWEFSPLGKILLRLPLPANRQFTRGIRTIDDVVHSMIEDRRGGSGEGEDLLSVLLTVTYADTGEHLTDHELRDQAVTLLMAGHETSSSALTWAYYLLGTHPEARTRMHEEIDAVLGDRLPTVEDLPHLTFTDGVYSEALRLYPPAWVLARRALEDCTVGGYRIPRDSLVLVSPYVMHRDVTWWPEPERFAPQRFLPEPDPSDPLTGHAHAEDRPKLAYFPFGAGPHQCIGNAFARLEGVMALATLGRHWEFVPAGDPPGVISDFALRPRGGLDMVAHRRP
ncbi:cytochrome P450 [Streptomyces sp. NPDC047108]|uniref:cytochrome P450 n=1 Tax=Streptomyces sp. NPDC047108 TaxID=3155025 RepID=UPI0033E45419